MVPGAEVLGTDLYYRDCSKLTAEERTAINFDAPAALDWDLMVDQVTRLKSGMDVTVPEYDFATHSRRARSRRFGPCKTLVLEGLFALWEPRIVAIMDLAVFLDAPAELCLARRVARDVATRGRTESSVRVQWRRDVAPMFHKHVLPTREHAGLVLDGTSTPRRSALAIIKRLVNDVRPVQPNQSLNSG